MIKILTIIFINFIFINQLFAQTLSKPPKIISSINPIYQIVNFISNDKKNSSLLIEPKSSSHSYYFIPSKIKALEKSDVIFYIGNDLENNLSKILTNLKTKPKIIQLTKSQNIKLLQFQSRFTTENNDPHIWLDPQNAIIIAQKITKTLSDLYPPNTKIYQNNFKKFQEDIIKMDKENKSQLASLTSKKFLVEHNGTAYFKNYYNIKIIGAIRYYHNQTFTIEEIQKLNDLIKKENISCILVSLQEGNGLAIQIANNNRIKFTTIDIIGQKSNNTKNGYTKIITDLVTQITKC